MYAGAAELQKGQPDAQKKEKVMIHVIFESQSFKLCI